MNHRFYLYLILKSVEYVCNVSIRHTLTIASVYLLYTNVRIYLLNFF